MDIYTTVEDRLKYWNDFHHDYRFENFSLDPALILALDMIVRQKPTGPVLDFGCGSGRSSNYLFEKDIDVEAVDVSSTATTKASKFIDSERIKLIDRGRIPFPDGHFSVVLMSKVLSVLSETSLRKNAKEEVLRVLSNDGILILVDFIFSTKNERRYQERTYENKTIYEIWPLWSAIPFWHIKKNDLSNHFGKMDLIVKYEASLTSAMDKTFRDGLVAVLRKK